MSVSSRDYIRASAPFETDSIPLRQDYERFFLDHKKAVQTAKKTMNTTNESVFGPNGLRARLAANHKVNVPRETRAMEIARDNSKLVERLTEISFKNHSATTNQIVERNKRAVSRLAPGGSLNDHIRAQERARIEEDNMGLAARLLANKSDYGPDNYRAHIRQHEYLIKSKSRLRAIQMKTSTPGQYLHGRTGRGDSPMRASTADHPHRNKEAEAQAADEYAGALRAYMSQQTSLGYGLPPTLPPIPGTSDIELLGQEDTWLESHQSDLQKLKQLHTHAPKVRQSLGINPREALRTPLSRHYHHTGILSSQEASRKQALALESAFQSLDSELVVPRTRLDPSTGAYETVWIELADAKPEETHLAQRRPDIRAAEVAAKERAEQAAIQQQQALAQWQYQQQAAAMYAAYVAHANGQQATGAPATESKEPMPSTNDSDSSNGFHPHPPAVSDAPSDVDASNEVAPPIWPFGGNILPPHLWPPPPVDPLASARVGQGRRGVGSVTARARLTASTKRGRTGRQLFKLRKGLNDTSRRGDQEEQKDTTTTRKADGNQSKHKWQSHAQHVEDVNKFTNTLNVGSTTSRSIQDESTSPTHTSKAASIPTISSSLGVGSASTPSSPTGGAGATSDSSGAPSSSHIRGASGVPIPAFRSEFEVKPYAQPKQTQQTSEHASAKHHAEHISPASSSSKLHRHPKSSKSTISPPSPATSSQSGPKPPLISPSARVSEKVDAFESVATGDSSSSDRIRAPAPPSSVAPASHRSSRRSSLHDIPLDVVSPIGAERAAKRGSIEVKSNELKDRAEAIDTPSQPTNSNSHEKEVEFVPTVKYSDSHPFSLAHSSSSASNLNSGPPTIADPTSSDPVNRHDEDHKNAPTVASTTATTGEVRPTTADLTFEMPDEEMEEL